MTHLCPTISINVLRAHVLRNGDRASAVNPVFRNARRFHASPAPRGRPAPVNVDSLTETLENHRLANNPLVIRKIELEEEPAKGPVKFVSLKARTSYSDSTSEQVLRKVETASAVERPAPRRVLGTSPTKYVSLKTGKEDPGSLPEGVFRVIRRVRKGQSSPDRAIASDFERDKGEKIEDPWLDFAGKPGTSGLERLGEEIEAFTTYMRSIPVEDEAAQKLQEHLSDILAAAGLPRPLLFGSRKTGMALRHSNLNMMIPLEDPDSEASDSDTGRGPSDTRPKISELQSIYLNNAFYILENNPQFSHCRLLRARIPRLRATHLPTGLTVSIQAGVKLPTTDDYVMNYVAEYPTLPQLYTVLRMVLETRAIFGQANDTTTSYGLIMLIVGALKLGEGTFDRHAELGKQLIHVLRIYGYANFRRYGVSIEPPGLFRKKQPRSVNSITAPAHIRGQISIGKRSAALQPSIVCLQDPANYMHDLGESFFRTLEVQGLFRDLVRRLEAGILAWEMKNGRTSAESVSGDFETLGHRVNKTLCVVAEELLAEADDAGRPFSILHPAVGGNYDFIERIRDKTVLALER